MLQENETYKIIGAAMAVHKELGCGFHEDVYQEAIEIEFKERGIPYEREKLINVYYHGKPLNKYYKADFICYGNIIVELKALSELAGEHEAQVINYLQATKIKIGLLINFGQRSLIHKRLTRV